MLIPLRNNLIVLAIADPDTWGSGIIIRPESTKDRADQGIVKVVGPDVRCVEVGDYVVFSPYSGMVLNVSEEGDRAILLSEDAIDCLITPANTQVSGLYHRTTELDFVPATAEASLLLIREAIQSLPRIIQVKKKWHLAQQAP